MNLKLGRKTVLQAVKEIFAESKTPANSDFFNWSVSHTRSSMLSLVDK